MLGIPSNMDGIPNNGMSSTLWACISYIIRWNSIVGYSVVGYSGQTWTEYPLHISFMIRWHSIVGYSDHFPRNTQRPEYPTFLLGILVVRYTRRWVFPMLGIPYSYCFNFVGLSNVYCIVFNLIFSGLMLMTSLNDENISYFNRQRLIIIGFHWVRKNIEI